MKTGCCNTHQFYRMEDVSFCLNTKCFNYLGQTALVTPKKSLWIGLFSLNMMVLFLFMSTQNYSKINVETAQQDINGSIQTLDNFIPLTLENIREEIYAKEILCPETVFAQIKLESGNLNSFLTKKTNNMLGMRYPAQRQTAAAGIYLPNEDKIIFGTQKELKKYAALPNYAVYSNWQDAISDYKLWQQHSFRLKEVYFAFLDRVYAEDPSYSAKLRQIYDQNTDI